MSFVFSSHVTDFIALIGRLLIDIAYLFTRPGEWPLKES